jgi:hypothetical protein
MKLSPLKLSNFCCLYFIHHLWLTIIAVPFNIFGNVSKLCRRFCYSSILFCWISIWPVFHRFNKFSKWKQMNNLNVILLSILDTRMMFAREISNILWPHRRNGEFCVCDESMFASANMISNGCWIFDGLPFLFACVFIELVFPGFFVYQINRFDQGGVRVSFQYRLSAQLDPIPFEKSSNFPIDCKFYHLLYKINEFKRWRW